MLRNIFQRERERCLPSPVDSILEAVLTVSPNRQYRGMVSPTTPATTIPMGVNPNNKNLKSNSIQNRNKQETVSVIEFWILKNLLVFCEKHNKI